MVVHSDYTTEKYNESTVFTKAQMQVSVNLMYFNTKVILKSVLTQFARRENLNTIMQNTTLVSDQNIVITLKQIILLLFITFYVFYY